MRVEALGRAISMNEADRFAVAKCRVDGLVWRAFFKGRVKAATVTRAARPDVGAARLIEMILAEDVEGDALHRVSTTRECVSSKIDMAISPSQEGLIACSRTPNFPVVLLSIKSKIFNSRELAVLFI